MCVLFSPIKLRYLHQGSLILFLHTHGTVTHLTWTCSEIFGTHGWTQITLWSTFHVWGWFKKVSWMSIELSIEHFNILSQTNVILLFQANLLTPLMASRR